ncbi:unnamed protein product [Aureobasidium pullulans]|nr:unnamed protein product [Aureobasidium pullulans]
MPEEDKAAHLEENFTKKLGLLPKGQISLYHTGRRTHHPKCCIPYISGRVQPSGKPSMDSIRISHAQWEF